ncbi:MAG: hypothetical protein H6730_11535 [Deltaproteobacteria bacterium]|nr:hypothetical protein [Deltaproteobacteria bacterium]
MAISTLLLALLAVPLGPVTVRGGQLPLEVVDRASPCGYHPTRHVEVVTATTGESRPLDRRYSDLLGELPDGELVVTNQRNATDHLEVAAVRRATGEVRYSCRLPLRLSRREVDWTQVSGRLLGVVRAVAEPTGVQRTAVPLRRAERVAVELELRDDGCTLTRVSGPATSGRAWRPLEPDALPAWAGVSLRLTRSDEFVLLTARREGRVLWRRRVGVVKMDCARP